MTVNICGIPHTVIEKEDSFDTDSHFGQIDYCKAEIRINKDMPKEMKAESLCHEMMHGILVHIGRTDLSNDEQFVQTLANAIYQGFVIVTAEDVEAIKKERDAMVMRTLQRHFKKDKGEE